MAGSGDTVMRHRYISDLTLTGTALRCPSGRPPKRFYIERRTILYITVFNVCEGSTLTCRWGFRVGDGCSGDDE